MKRIAFLLTMVMLLVLLVACTEPTPETYTVDFIVNGETISQVYEKGQTPTPPTVEDYTTLNMSYTFTGWDKEIVAVTENATYTAQFTGAIKEFNVTFIYGGATEGTPVKVPFGATPSAPTDGLNYQTADKVYTFIGWDKQVQPATADAVYTARYSSVAREYDVTFKYGDPSALIVTTAKVAYGTVPTAPTTGLDYLTADKKFTFKAWDKTVSEVTGDVTYTATYTESARDYTITFVYDGKTETVTLSYGATVTLPTPVGYTKDGATYSFAGTWDKTPVAVAGDATYTANYTLIEKVLYNMNFDSESFDHVGETDTALNVILGDWMIAAAKPYTAVAMKTVVDPSNAANKYLALGLSNTTATINANLRPTGGLTTMESLTKLTIKLDLAKKADVKTFDSYMRFRATGTSDVIKFLETTNSSQIKFFGTVVGTLTETFQTIEMTFDFATGAATVSIDGTPIDSANATMTVPSKSSAASLLDWVATTAGQKYIFNWGVTANCSNNEKGLLVDNLSVVAH